MRCQVFEVCHSNLFVALFLQLRLGQALEDQMMALQNIAQAVAGRHCKALETDLVSAVNCRTLICICSGSVRQIDLVLMIVVYRSILAFLEDIVEAT